MFIKLCLNFILLSCFFLIQTGLPALAAGLPDLQENSNSSIPLQPGMEIPQYASPSPAPGPSQESPSQANSYTENTGNPQQGLDQSQESTLSAKDAAQFSGDLSAMEDRLYGHDFSNEPITSRLNRLERMVFGSAKEGSISDRVTQLLLDLPKLPDLEQAQTVPAPAPAYADPYTGPSSFNGPQPAPSLKAEVAAMEQQVYGKTYPSDRLNQRVKRLETSVFANQTSKTFGSISDRINKLASALQPRFAAPNTMGQNTPVLASTKNANMPAEEKQKHGHPFLKKLGHALEQTAIIAGRSVGGMAMGSMMGGYGMGGYGMGGYGMGGYGMGGYGMGGYGW